MGVAIVIIGVLLLFLMTFLFWLSVIFNRFEKDKKNDRWVTKTGALLQSVKEKKNVTIYGRSSGNKRERMFFKHLSKGVYIYTVNGKQYRIKDTGYGRTSRQMPYSIPVNYFKPFPRISYVASGIQLYSVYALLCLMPAIAFLVEGIEMILK